MVSHAVSPTRALVIEGLPRCAGKNTYARPVVVRLDRERALFEDPWSVQLRIDAPPELAAPLADLLDLLARSLRSVAPSP